jgi:hypothetical protein
MPVRDAVLACLPSPRSSGSCRRPGVVRAPCRARALVAAAAAWKIASNQVTEISARPRSRALEQAMKRGLVGYRAMDDDGGAVAGEAQSVKPGPPLERLLAAGRCVRVGALMTSEGIGGTGGLGGAVPLGDEDGRVTAGPGPGWGAAGSGTMVFPGRWGPAAASSATAWSAAGRNAATEGGRAAASRRPGASASAAGGCGPGRPFSRRPCGGHRRVHASRTACGILAAAF